MKAKPEITQALIINGNFKDYFKQKIESFYMSLEQKVMTELKRQPCWQRSVSAALRSLRANKAAILLAKTAEGASGEIKEDEEEIKLLQKLVKQRKRLFGYFSTTKRADLARKEQEEIVIYKKRFCLSSFLQKG